MELIATGCSLATTLCAIRLSETGPSPNAEPIAAGPVHTAPGQAGQALTGRNAPSLWWSSSPRMLLRLTTSHNPTCGGGAESRAWFILPPPFTSHDNQHVPWETRPEPHK